MRCVNTFTELWLEKEQAHHVILVVVNKLCVMEYGHGDQVHESALPLGVGFYC